MSMLNNYFRFTQDDLNSSGSNDGGHGGQPGPSTLSVRAMPHICCQGVAFYMVVRGLVCVCERVLMCVHMQPWCPKTPVEVHHIM